MPLGQSTPKTYLAIAYGKLRKKGQKGDAGVVERFNDKGEPNYAYEYNNIEGKIVDVYYKESREFGNSYEVTIDDGELYQVSFKESSRYGKDFISKLPGIDFTKWVKITPYEMKDDNGKERRGISVQQNGDKLKSFFTEKVGDKFVYKHGFPPGREDGKMMNEKEWKIYDITVQDFLASYTKEHIIPKLKGVKDAPAEPIVDTQTPDDVPF